MKTGCCKTSLVYNTGDQIICINSDCSNYLCETPSVKGIHKWKNTLAVSVFLLYIVFSLDDFGMEKENSIPQMQEQVPLTLSNLKQELEQQNIICQKEVLAQIVIESGNLQSFLVKRTNNMLGMRYPFKRETLACGIYLPDQDTIVLGNQKDLKKYSRTNNYAVYKNWKHAVADYKLWQDHCFKLSDRYVSFLGDVYAEDTLYVKKIQKMVANPM